MDTKQQLDGTVEDVKIRLSGLDAATLTALLAAEQAGKNRKGVIDAIEHAQTEASTAADTTSAANEAATNQHEGAVDASAIATDGTLTTTHASTFSASTTGSADTSGPADIAAATDFEPSGAPMQTTSIDVGHPAVDANPRANTTENQNRIDFNDPRLDGREVVEAQLAAQAK